MVFDDSDDVARGVLVVDSTETTAAPVFVTDSNSRSDLDLVFEDFGLCVTERREETFRLTRYAVVVATATKTRHVSSRNQL